MYWKIFFFYISLFDEIKPIATHRSVSMNGEVRSVFKYISPIEKQDISNSGDKQDHSSVNTRSQFPGTPLPSPHNIPIPPHTLSFKGRRTRWKWKIKHHLNLTETNKGNTSAIYSDGYCEMDLRKFNKNFTVYHIPNNTNRVTYFWCDNFFYVIKDKYSPWKIQTFVCQLVTWIVEVVNVVNIELTSSPILAILWLVHTYRSDSGDEGVTIIIRFL